MFFKINEKKCKTKLITFIKSLRTVNKPSQTSDGIAETLIRNFERIHQACQKSHNQSQLFPK